MSGHIPSACKEPTLPVPSPFRHVSVLANSQRFSIGDEARQQDDLDTDPTLPQDVRVNRARVFEEALALSAKDRLELAAELLASSPPPGILQAGSPELAEAVKRRLESVRRGDAKPVPARRALAKLRRRRTDR
jgi:hypothetical protein